MLPLILNCQQQEPSLPCWDLKGQFFFSASQPWEWPLWLVPEAIWPPSDPSWKVICAVCISGGLCRNWKAWLTCFKKVKEMELTCLVSFLCHICSCCCKVPQSPHTADSSSNFWSWINKTPSMISILSYNCVHLFGTEKNGTLIMGSESI